MLICATCKRSDRDTKFYQRRRCSYCIECQRSKQAVWNRANHSKKLEYNRRWRQRNKARRSVMLACTNVFWRAIRGGKLERGTQCAFCGSTSGIEGAHTDYDKPLFVIWLCRSCHRQWDSLRPKTIEKNCAQPPPQAQECPISSLGNTSAVREEPRP